MKNFEVKISNGGLEVLITDMSMTEMSAFWLLAASEIYSRLLMKDPISAAVFKHNLQRGVENASPVWNGKSMPGVAMVAFKEKNPGGENDD